MAEILNRIQPLVHPVDNISIPGASIAKLRNGIPVFTIESGTEDIMRIEFTFRAGQIKESKPMIAGICNMMLTEGSEKYPASELNRLLDYYGIFLNQNSEKDRAGIVIFCLSKHLSKAMELAREILFFPAFPENELNTMLQKRLNWFLVNRTKVQNLAMDKFNESVFGKDHPYGRMVSENDFGNVVRDDISTFHGKWYNPADMAIIISGKVAAETNNILDDLFGELNTPDVITCKTAKPEGESGKIFTVIRKDAVQTAIRIGSQTINKRDSDYPGLKVIDTILGGYFSSRLMKNLREEKGYTYGISSSVTSLDLTGYKIISTDVGSKYFRSAVDEIFYEIGRLQKEPVGNDELEIVRNYMSGEMLRMFDGPFALAESFRSVWEFGLDNNYYHSLAKKIKTINSDEIISLANTYYKPEDLYVVSAGPE